MLGLFEAGVEPPAALIGTSVGALNAATIATHPSSAGVGMLRQMWLSRLARGVFHGHPAGIVLSRLRGAPLSAFPASNVRRLIRRQQELMGIHGFEQLKLPLAVVATDLGSGKPVVFRSGPLEPALLASTAIPGIFPPVALDGTLLYDGGIVDNTPLDIAVESGAKEVLAISLMAGGELEKPPRTWGTLIARTLQLALHHQMLSDFERLRRRGRLTVLCPILSPANAWDLKRENVETAIESAREATVKLLASRGSRLFRHSGVHYLEVSD